MASCALPILFPPVRVGASYYGDGCIRLTAPLSAPIHLGADRVLAIGVRHMDHAHNTLRNQEAAALLEQPTFAQIGGVLMNAVFVDSLETDLERAVRINNTLSRIPSEQRTAQRLRILPLLAFRPSHDLGTLASDLLERFPLPVRHLLRGIGAPRDTGWEMLSYLAFEEGQDLKKVEDATHHPRTIDEQKDPTAFCLPISALRQKWRCTGKRRAFPSGRAESHHRRDRYQR